MTTIDNSYAGLGLALPTPASNKQLGQDDFLRLMTTQLQNQDPFKPMESGEFLSQIAQFSTVSGIQEMQASVAALASSLTSSQTLQAAGLVGRSVLVPSEIGYLPEGGSLQGAVVLPHGGAVAVDLVDASGQVVRQLDLGTRPAGTARFAWDGLGSGGARLPAGNYTLRARLDAGGTPQSVATLAVGQVESVALGSQGLSLSLLGLPGVALSDVQQIL